MLGAFDPIDDIADLCQEFSCWLHVDAAWGGAVLISQKHRQLMKGNCWLINRSKQLLNHKSFRMNSCRLLHTVKPLYSIRLKYRRVEKKKKIKERNSISFQVLSELTQLLGTRTS